VLHLPFEIRIVVERDPVAERDADAEAVRAGIDREAVADVEARREPIAAARGAGALVGAGEPRKREKDCRDQYNVDLDVNVDLNLNVNPTVDVAGNGARLVVMT
jgi:hypothetical protein